MSEVISPDLRQSLRRLKLSPMLETLPERLQLARQQQLPYQDFLELILADEVSRRDRISAQLRARAALLEANMTLEAWDDSTEGAAPIVTWQMWWFVSPGLRPHERRLILPGPGPMVTPTRGTEHRPEPGRHVRGAGVRGGPESRQLVLELAVAHAPDGAQHV